MQFQRVFVGGAAVLQLGQLIVQPGILGKGGLQLPAEIVLLRFGPQLGGAQGLQQGLAGLFVLEAAQRIVMIGHGKLHPGRKGHCLSLIHICLRPYRL